MSRKKEAQFDPIVLGTGVAGLSTALTVSNEGLKVLLLKKTNRFDGTTYRSAGTCWISGSRYVEETGIANDLVEAEICPDALVSDRGPKEVWITYIQTEPRIIDYMGRLEIKWIPFPGLVDYYPELGGSGRGYRALEPEPFSGKAPGKIDFSHLRSPLSEFALLGGSLIVRRIEVTKLLHLFDGQDLHERAQAVGTALHLGIAWVWDLLWGWPRGTRVVVGNTLIGRLYREYKKHGGTMWLNAITQRLTIEDGRVTGAVVEYQGISCEFKARKGVALAAGDLPVSPTRRNQYLRKPATRYTAAAGGSTGDTFALAESAGGTIDPEDESGALWFPSSVGYQPDGSQTVFLHIWDCAKLGMIAVNATDERFTDEARSYNHFARGMYESDEAGVPTVPAWLAADHDHMRRYDLSIIYPGLFTLRHWFDSGYLFKVRTLAELAVGTGVDPRGLEETVRKFNANCALGKDSLFGKGESEYSPQYGDLQTTPNVNLGSPKTAPSYTMAVYPTPLSTGRGTLINPDGQALDAGSRPIEGLYVAGSDAQQVFDIQYPGGGCQVGSGVVFGYRIGKYAAGREA